MNYLLQKVSQNNKQIRLALLGLVLLLLPFELYPRVEFHGIAIRLSQVVGVALIAFCLPIIWQKRHDWLKNPWVLFTLFILVSTLSALFALSRTRGLLVTTFYTFDFVLAYAVTQTFSVRFSEIYKKIIFGVGLLVVAFCTFQFMGDTLGIANSYTLLDIRYTKLIFGFARVQGFSLEPLYLANYLFIPLCLSLVSFIFSYKKTPAILSFIFITTIWLTVARGAYVGALAVLLGSGLLMIYLKKWRELAVTTAIAAASVMLALGMIRLSGSFARQVPADTVVPANLQTTIPQEGIDAGGNTTRLIEHTTSFASETSVQDRKQSWRVAINLFAARPLLGVGPGNFGRYVVQVYPKQFVDTNQITNNETLELLAEVGLLGFALIAIFAIWLFFKALQFSIRRNTKPTNTWFFATGFMLIAFIIQWQTFSTLYVTHIWVMIGIFIGVVTHAHSKASEISSTSTKKLSK